MAKNLNHPDLEWILKKESSPLKVDHCENHNTHNLS